MLAGSSPPVGTPISALDKCCLVDLFTSRRCGASTCNPLAEWSSAAVSVAGLVALGCGMCSGLAVDAAGLRELRRYRRWERWLGSRVLEHCVHAEAWWCVSERLWSLKRAFYRLVTYVWIGKRSVCGVSKPQAEISVFAH